MDNDGDGYIDCDDYDCSRNSAVTVCGTSEQPTDSAESTNEACSDGISNDGDDYIDCEDYDCSRNQEVTVCNGNDGPNNDDGPSAGEPAQNGGEPATAGEADMGGAQGGAEQ